MRRRLLRDGRPRILTTVIRSTGSLGRLSLCGTEIWIAFCETAPRCTGEQRLVCILITPAYKLNSHGFNVMVGSERRGLSVLEIHLMRWTWASDSSRPS